MLESLLRLNCATQPKPHTYRDADSHIYLNNCSKLLLRINHLQRSDVKYLPESLEK